MKKYHLYRFLFLFSMSFAFIFLRAQEVEIIKLWETDKILNTPESIRFFPEEDVLFVSNINGSGSAKNGLGYISIVNTDATIKEKQWVKGLNAPKGMDILDRQLFISDIDELTIVNIDSAKIIKKIPVKGAKYLNDVSADTIFQRIYISDSKAGKLIVYAYDIQLDSVYIFYENPDIKIANGLTNTTENLYIGSKNLYRLSKDSLSLSTLVKNTKEIDGLEAFSDTVFIGTNWNGHIFGLTSDGKQHTLENSKALGYYTADVGIDKKNHKLYVPTSTQNSIIAYKYIIK